MSKKLSQSDSVNEMVGSEIKLAGNENKVKMYESKHKRKLIRVLTVVAYVFFVSLAAIMLSLFYMFIYNPSKLTVKKNMGIGFTDNLVYQPKLQEPEDSMPGFNDSVLEREEPRVLPLSEKAIQSLKLPNYNKFKLLKESTGNSDLTIGKDIKKKFLKMLKFLKMY